MIHSSTVGQGHLRVGFVGCGAIVGSFHLPAALACRSVKVTALVEPAQERAHELVRKFRLSARVATRIEEVLGEVDGLVIATPNHTHAQLAKAALGEGVAVLVEKPLAITYADAVELCELAEQHRTILAVGYKTRYHPNVRLMKQLLERERFGALRWFHYEFGSAGGWAPLSAYNLDRTQTGGGVLVTTGTHFLDRMLYWFGVPEILEYQDDSYGGPEANCRARVRFDGRAGRFEGTLVLSKTVTLRNRFRLHTDDYEVELSDSETESLSVRSRAQPDVLMRFSQGSAGTAPDYFVAQMADFAECIRTGRPPLVDGRWGALSVKLAEDFYRLRTPLPEPWMWYRREAPHG